VVVVDRNSHQDQLASAVLSAPVVLMAVAPNGRFLACFTSGGILTVLSTNFETKVLDFDTSTASRPVQMEWCGEDSVVLYWKHFLLMVGPFGHWVRYVVLRLCDCDCCCCCCCCCCCGTALRLCPPPRLRPAPCTYYYYYSYYY